MAVDGIFLHVITRQLQELVGAKIGKVHSVSDYGIALALHKAPYRYLDLSLDSNTNRIYLSNTSRRFVDPTSFVMVLRKTIAQGIIRAVSQRDFDRIISIEVESTNEIGLKKRYTLVIELMGKYANAILLDQQGVIIESLKHISSLDSSKRMIYPSVPYEFPDKPSKQNPLLVSEPDLNTSLVSQIEGFSPVLSREFIYRINKGESYEQLIEEVLNSRQVYRYPQDFHLLRLTHLELDPAVYPLFEGLEQAYAQTDEAKHLLQKYRPLFLTIRSEIKKLSKKIPKLEKNLEENRGFDIYRRYGDLILMNAEAPYQPDRLEAYDYETEQTISIPLDPRMNLRQNARQYFKKYQKAKRSLSILEEQIKQAKDDLEYFEQLQTQSELASLEDLEEIEQELINKRFMLKKPSAKKKQRKPSILHLNINGSEVYVGKNNIQNEYLLRHLAGKNDYWFHVKDYHGSYVLLKNPDPDEELIRACAMLAARFSKSRYSSSVPVNYTPVHQLRRIPGAKSGLISMKKYRTIYIDPDDSFCRNLIDNYSSRKNG